MCMAGTRGKADKCHAEAARPRRCASGRTADPEGRAGERNSLLRLALTHIGGTAIVLPRE
jgi:hypothetical protein